MTRVVLATTNPGKLSEIQTLLAALEMTIMPQSAFQVPSVEETGLSFVENAIIKARHAAGHTGLPAIADDSGLEVDALAGMPGIRSARYAGPRASDKENVDKLLKELRQVPESQRQARFHCVLVYLRHAADPTPLICQGSWAGHIALLAGGSHGFGYDPVFYLPELGRTAAELEPEHKNRLSH